MKICTGGTFDNLHKGHKTLIKKAFEIADEKGIVFIGITTDDFAKDKKNVKPLKQRVKNLEKYFKKEGYHNYIIKPISDKFGPSITGDFDTIIVSSETIKTAKEINKKREKIGKKSLEIVEIKSILAEDGLRISSTRIRNKEIDKNGKIIK